MKIILFIKTKLNKGEETMEIFNANGFVPEGVLDTNGDCYIGILTKTKYKKEDYQINSERNALISQSPRPTANALEVEACKSSDCLA